MYSHENVLRPPPLCRDLKPELLAPGGGPEAAVAALHYGADAVYCGLRRFSARAEAVNFTMEELGDLLGYARSLAPRRRVFVTLNTVTLTAEMPERLRLAARLAELGVDGIIVQDLGLAWLLRRHFPEIPLHGSTQMAIHSLEGVQTARDLGLRRVNLARELTLEEIRAISRDGGVETEVFIHGALCYSYSGLCLLSSHLLGRSGNRGRCGYPCRDLYRREDAPGKSCLPFSMMDLAQGGAVAELQAAGVAALKIEGRMKSPLYVAAITHYYRQLLDGQLASAAARGALEEDLRTIFSRAQTSLHLHGRRREGVIDPELTGHRGAPIGAVTAARRLPDGSTRLAFTTRRELERHDGIQLDLAVGGRPFGFALQDFTVRGPRADAHVAPAGSTVELLLPPGAPAIPVGTVVNCASSQRVKRSYAVPFPKPGAHRPGHPVQIRVTLTATGAAAVALARSVPAGAGCSASATAQLAEPLAGARDAAGTERAVRACFERLGDTPFRLAGLELENPDGRFVPASRLNALRRELLAKLAPAWEAALDQRADAWWQAAVAELPRVAAGAAAPEWVLAIDRLESVREFTPADWEGCAELVVDVSGTTPEALPGLLGELRARVGDRLRLALPPVCRAWETAELRRRIAAARAAGVDRWLLANLADWHLLGAGPTSAAAVDWEADWFLPTFNPATLRQLQELGCRRVTLSPEDGVVNLAALLRAAAPALTIVVYQDTPLFISEACAQVALAGSCAGAACHDGTAPLRSDKGGQYLLRTEQCRNWLLNQRPFGWPTQWRELQAYGARRFRVDLLRREYAPAAALQLWRDLRAGRPVPGTHPGNWSRGLEA